MNAADWIVDYFIKLGTTDAFGIPGAVFLDLLYAMEKRRPEFTPHLVYHEQGGAFAASGYAQTSGKLGVAYGTRGPGFTNMVTGIADAYYDSIPVLFLTAHSAEMLHPDMRILNNQEIDTVSIVKNITKFAARINTLEELKAGLKKACSQALTGRKGPVFLDICSKLFSQELAIQIEDTNTDCINIKTQHDIDLLEAIKAIKKNLLEAKQPVILIGNGLRNKNDIKSLSLLAEKNHIPVLSSRTAHDILPFSPMFYGHIGSHATRYSNFILSKSDLIITLGNRLAFPITSKSFKPLVEKTHFIRIDIDSAEFKREVPNTECYKVDLHDLLMDLSALDLNYKDFKLWIKKCNVLKEKLLQFDKNEVVEKLMIIMSKTDLKFVFVSDVGNNSFWVTNAYAYDNCKNRILYSGSFGTLGCALPKAIGAYYASNSPVICFVGDQGLQMNSQELEFIGREKLPISIVILNNNSSGMIKEREDKRFNSKYVHTTLDSGYNCPDFEKLANAYGLEYIKYDGKTDVSNLLKKVPSIIEIKFSDKLDLYPYLPIGDLCQDLYPYIDRTLYNKLNAL